MPTFDLSHLSMQSRHLQMVRQIVANYAHNAEVWAYGSRVTGGGHEGSDLDLMIRNPVDPTQEQLGLSSLKGAFMESNLPIRVDVVDWARIPDYFRREIQKGYVIIQKGESS